MSRRLTIPLACLTIVLFIGSLQVVPVPNGSMFPMPHLQPATCDLPSSSSFLMLNSPALVVQSPSGDEASLTWGTHYKAEFYGADQAADFLKDTIDHDLYNAIKASGADTNINISSDRRHATLKDGQTVYYVVKLLPAGYALAEKVTFVLTTVPKSGIPDITNNYFKIKYAMSPAGGVGQGNIVTEDDSTSGKAYQVINPAGEKLWYFAFTAVARTGGIQTTIETHFFKGPSIAEVVPQYIQCCCEHVKTPLLKVPEPQRCFWYYIPYVGDLFLAWYRWALYCKVVKNTENVPCTHPEATGKELTIKGDRLRRFSETDILNGLKITDDCGQEAARVAEVTSITESEIKVKIDITVCKPGVKTVKLNGAGGIATVTFLKIVQDVPDTIVTQKRFTAVRIFGTQEKVQLTMTLAPGEDGQQNIVYADNKYQIYNVTCMTRCSDTQMTGWTTGRCANILTDAKQGTCDPGEDNQSADGTSVNCLAPMDNADINLTTDIDGKNRFEPNAPSGDEKIVNGKEIEEDPGVIILTRDDAIENSFMDINVKDVLLTRQSLSDDSLVVLSMETLEGTSPVIEVLIGVEGEGFYQSFLSVDGSAIVDEKVPPILGVIGLRPGTARLKLMYIDSSGQAGDISGIKTDVIVFHVADLKIVDAQAFEPYLEKTASGSTIPRLKKDLESVVDQSYVRRGAWTDGASIVVLRFSNIDTSDVQVQVQEEDDITVTDTTYIGSVSLGNKDQLPALPASPSGGGSSVVQLKGAKTVVYRPPVSWRYDLRSSPKGALYFIIKKGDREIGERAFFLIPPPLVLVHGILSGPTTWKNFVKRITDAKYIVSTRMVDYSRTTTSGFDVNNTPLREQVYKIIQEYRDFRIAATRTDVLCHSMGGALARWWFMDLEGSISREPRLGAYEDNLTFDKELMYSGTKSYKRGDNYGLGSVRRFITVGTPHLGSYWANAVAKASHTVLGTDALSGYMLAKGIKDIDAISDLAVDSSAMKVLKVSGTNTQSRYTGGNLGPIEIPPNSDDDPLLELYYMFLSHVVDRLGDGIVGMESQGNGVVPASKNTIDNVFHTQETASEGLFNIVIRLLRDDMLREFDASTNTFVR